MMTFYCTDTIYIMVIFKRRKFAHFKVTVTVSEISSSNFPLSGHIPYKDTSESQTLNHENHF